MSVAQLNPALARDGVALSCSSETLCGGPCPKARGQQSGPESALG